MRGGASRSSKYLKTGLIEPIHESSRFSTCGHACAQGLGRALKLGAWGGGFVVEVLDHAAPLHGAAAESVVEAVLGDDPHGQVAQALRRAYEAAEAEVSRKRCAC